MRHKKKEKKKHFQDWEPQWLISFEGDFYSKVGKIITVCDVKCLKINITNFIIVSHLSSGTTKLTFDSFNKSKWYNQFCEHL